MKISKYILIILIIIGVFAFSFAFAANPKVQLNGNIMDFTDEQGNKVEAQLINNRTMVPLRKIFESLGCTIDWDQETKTVTAKSNGKTIKLTIGSSNAYVINGSNEEKIVLDSAPVIVDNRTLVPLRFIAESLGCDVGWDQSNQTAIIIDYDSLAQLFKAKSSYLYYFFTNPDEVTLTRKYFDEWDPSRNDELSLQVKNSKSTEPIGRKASLKFTGNSAFVTEITNEEWNDFSYTVLANDESLITSNYVFSSMFGGKKNETIRVKFEDYGLSKAYSQGIANWIKQISDVDSIEFNINTYKDLKTDWQKFVNTFFNGSKTLKATDFSYKYISLEKLASNRVESEAVNAFLILNKNAFRLNLDYQDILSDYPTISYSFTAVNDTAIKIRVVLKSDYKDRVEYEATMITYGG